MAKIKRNTVRVVLQLGVIAVITAFFFKILGNETFDPEAYCPMGGIQTFATYLVQGSMACSMTTTQISIGLLLIVGVVLFGKLFCSYLCPLGTFTEFLAKLRARLNVKAIIVKDGTIADKFLRLVKYVLLFWIFYMTVTASELFCKNFDPYYAFATGFKGELTMWMAMISIAIFFLCSFFINMFWCKYICPLGAITNISKFGITFIALIGVFAGLNYIGINISWVVLLAALCVIGYIFEIVYMKSKVFPVLNIVRDTNSCNDCGLCAKKCPYNIKVDTLKVVKHIDCTACGECIEACNKQSLSFNKRKGLKWVPVVAVLSFFALGVYLGTTMELPTIDEKWGDEAKHENLSELEVEGLRSVKCFGSSKAFAATLQKIPGVYGVATYVKHAKVNIYYNPAETTDSLIRESIYVPSKFKINHPTKADSLMKVLVIRTEKMHDKLDPNYLGMQFRNSGRKYFGLETEYACPIIVRLYMGMDEPVDKKFLKEMVELKVLQMPVHGGGTREVNVDYELIDVENIIDTITRKEFLVRQFTATKRVFKDNSEKYADEKKSVYELIYPDLDKPLITRNIPYLTSCLSLTDGIIGVETLVNDNEEYAMRITYVDSIMDPDKLWSLISAPTWRVKMKTGEITDVEAKFKFPSKGSVIDVK